MTAGVIIWLSSVWQVVTSPLSSGRASANIILGTNVITEHHLRTLRITRGPADLGHDAGW